MAAAMFMLCAASLVAGAAPGEASGMRFHGACAPPIVSGGDNASAGLLREVVARTALAQLSGMDSAWHPQQRDCAGLVRFVFREAFKTLAPCRLEAGLWRDRTGAPTAFADAETLVAYNFALLGRGDEARSVLQSGDLVAFRQMRSEDEGPIYHLMVVVRSPDPAHAETLVVYHPGERDAAVRMGSLVALARDAPREWQPVPDNPFFLGFLRLREWMRHE